MHLFTGLFLFNATSAQVDKNQPWHNIERSIHYQPQGNDFILYKGSRKFNRALYGTNTGFRVEAGDLPEFALYMPGMGGNCKIGISTANGSKWLTAADIIKTLYRPGSMLYEIKDSLLGDGLINLTVLAMSDAEGMIMKVQSSGVPERTSLVIVYGGATGKKFSRDGDIGADPESSFYLQPAYCKDNSYIIEKNKFRLLYGLSRALSEEERYEIQYGNKQPDTTKEKAKELVGVFPPQSVIRLADADQQASPDRLFESSATSLLPIISAKLSLVKNEAVYFGIQKPSGKFSYEQLPGMYDKAEAARKKLADRILLQTPDPYINPLGAALAVAADGIWEEPSYMHGAIAWRMRLPAWRGAYCADPLGWHDRARKHFSSYALSQVTKIPPGPVVFDTTLHIARQQEKMGTAMFSNGYISRNPGGDIRPHHYDMNLVFVDQLLNHFNYAGDIAFVKKMWPLIKLHLQWEKRNYDADDDGLYDAYAAIWASDALQYTGGGVTHSSAYNYRANRSAAKLAGMIGEDGAVYEAEATKILAAMNKKLWLADKGWFAENVDLMGLQLAHPSAGLWTVYHAIDENTADAQQRYQLLRYVDNYIPHIPVKLAGLKDEGYHILATSNWQPYTWSINNVALGENLHTALAYWQGGENDSAYKLFKSTLVESMYGSASPGGFQQLSFYDAIRGELYRDFADGIGVTARALTEGLFGILPDALNDQLLIKPGFPSTWNFAKISVPDISIDFRMDEYNSQYSIVQTYSRLLDIQMQVKADREKVVALTVNGKPANWAWIQDALGQPMIKINVGKQTSAVVKVKWGGNKFLHLNNFSVHDVNEKGGYPLFFDAKCTGVEDPQHAISDLHIDENKILFTTGAEEKFNTIFFKLQQGEAKWLEPVTFKTVDKNKTKKEPFKIPVDASFSNIDLQSFFNDKISQIFQNKYLSPRPSSPTLQLPWQGIGNWCYPLTMANINDSGMRVKAGPNNMLYLDKIPFATPSAMEAKNIIYTSQWDNYPKTVTVPLNGKAQHVYLLMAGTTNHQQSRFTNAKISVTYTDGTTDELPLINPTNWWPIEQDYLEDGYAFTTGAPRPYRLILKSGEFTKSFKNYSSIKGFSNRAIDGGAATVIEMPLQQNKELKHLTLATIANEVVVGLMSVTLVR